MRSNEQGEKKRLTFQKMIQLKPFVLKKKWTTNFMIHHMHYSDKARTDHSKNERSAKISHRYYQKCKKSHWKSAKNPYKKSQNK